MPKFLKKTIDIGGYVTTIWSFIPAATQTTITAGLTAVTAYFGYNELGLARAIFLSTGVFAFGMTVVFLWLRISQMIGTFQRLSVAALHIPNVALDSEQKPTFIRAVTVQIIIRNDSQTLMFYQLRRVTNVIESKVPAADSLGDGIISIPPNGGIHHINFATIENIPFPDKKELRVSGRFEVEIAYGPSKDSLDYLFTYGSTIQIAFAKNPATKNHAVAISSGITKFEHKKV